MSRIVRKPDFCLGENKGADQLRGKISAFVFATRIVQFLFYLNPKFQASSSFLSLYRPVCVGPGRKPPKTGFLASRLILSGFLAFYVELPLQSTQRQPVWLGHKHQDSMSAKYIPP